MVKVDYLKKNSVVECKLTSPVKTESFLLFSITLKNRGKSQELKKILEERGRQNNIYAPTVDTLGFHLIVKASTPSIKIWLEWE